MTRDEAGVRVFHAPVNMEEVKFVARIILGAIIDPVTSYTGSPAHRLWMRLRDFLYPYDHSHTQWRRR